MSRPLRAAAVTGAAVFGLTLCIPFTAAAVAVAGGALGDAPGRPETLPPVAGVLPGGFSDPVGAGSSASSRAVAWALARVGTPYRWGGTGPGGFDCSGLVQAAYADAGITLPRVAQAQFDAGPPARGDLVPGDLVFFGTDGRDVDHVGIALGDGLMVDAPHAGAVVRVEAIWRDGYVGATRPTP